MGDADIVSRYQNGIHITPVARIKKAHPHVAVIGGNQDCLLVVRNFLSSVTPYDGCFHILGGVGIGAQAMTLNSGAHDTRMLSSVQKPS